VDDHGDGGRKVFREEKKVFLVEIKLKFIRRIIPETRRKLRKKILVKYPKRR